ncbi:hypothetical protein [Pseudonocardia sp. TMWB2A]|uniref:hypothetical protein n=1 Tax=Pseudonocardia sp. TMWB2A TaxID=687430 RepID=UPI00307E60F2
MREISDLTKLFFTVQLSHSVEGAMTRSVVAALVNYLRTTDFDFRLALRLAAGFTTLVLIGVFIQKSDGNSAVETILLLGCSVVGVLALTLSFVCVVDFVQSETVHTIRENAKATVLSLMATVGAATMLVWPLQVIDSDEKSYTQPEVNHLGKDTGALIPSFDRPAVSPPTDLPRSEMVSDSDDLSLRNLQILEGRGVFRISVAVQNKRQVSIAVTRFEIEGSVTEAMCASPGESYRIELRGPVTFTPAGVLHDGSIGRIGEPFDVRATGSLVRNTCGGVERFKLAAPLELTLDPLGATNFSLDLNEKELRSIRFDRLDHLALSMEVSDSSASILRDLR